MVGSVSSWAVRLTTKAFIFAASAVILAACTTSSSEAVDDSAFGYTAPNFEGGYFSPTNGRVGYHMVATSHFHRTPCGRPNDGISSSSWTITGTVPPGLSAPDPAIPTFVFEGTPRQAGDWTITFTWHHLSCASRPEDFGDVSYPVNFHIDP
ncbi:MAG TPA: hypothetical protein VKT70_06975 [Stellaceae bacterium]|nr:hypothetical protein [Stellaceae bacterium]